MQPDYDVLIIGSGFGGSVSALRLTEKGYRVGVLEAGRRFADEEFAKTSWNLRKFLWMPKLGMYGIQRIHLLRNVMILAGAGVGGGSLNYANTLYVPPDPFFNDPQWKDITDWCDELMPHYDQAQRMLGVVQNPTFTDADKVMKRSPTTWVSATRSCRRRSACSSDPTAEDAGQDRARPVLRRRGPDRTGCIECGSCMTGCRYGAKNTLLKNYLGLAESAGAQVHPMTTVTGFKQRADGLWEVETAHTGASCAGSDGRSSPTIWFSPRARSARRSCCSRCATAASCRSCPTSSACSPAPTPNRSSAQGGWRCVTTST